ncbi:thiolase family protein [Burkholderia territorii]|uniref:thiolase family protein n=1 Tax=Burkholderia territorii TaxID=1503055 RepID=UPI00075ACACC|nr:thiolase family protein [Burkholderia territorii]KVQ61110.1 acetyl-CoA acyltransferase [Burkholderia territorii]KWA30892.1 acetyl-CoA acyltransferase [Burkholderia territorii]
MGRTVTIIGTAALPVGKWQTPSDAAQHTLEHEVLTRLVLDAVADAGVEKADIGTLSLAQCRPYTLQKYFATFIAHHLRLPCSGSVAEILGNGMTGALAFDHAANDILLGRAKVALALGVNFETATGAAEHMMSSMRAVGDIDFQGPFGITPIAWYAMDAARYMHEHDASREEIASVAVKNRAHAVLNPLAQFRRPITLDDVLAQPMIVKPLGLYEVPPRGDGAVCLVLAEEDVARGLGRPYVRVRSRGFFHEGAHQISEVPNDMTGFVAAQTAGRAAFDAAGVTPADLDFAELYAPCTIVEVLVSEALGLVPRGCGARWAAHGETRLGGRLPICTSGGLQSRGHPAYVTPFYSFVEAVEQLRGRAGERQVANAQLALTSAELGNYNAALIHILEAVR